MERCIEYLIIHLYSNGSFGCDAVYKKKIGDCISLDDLGREKWKVISCGQWIEHKPYRWAMVILSREGVKR